MVQHVKWHAARRIIQMKCERACTDLPIYHNVNGAFVCFFYTFYPIPWRYACLCFRMLDENSVFVFIACFTIVVATNFQSENMRFCWPQCSCMCTANPFLFATRFSRIILQLQICMYILRLFTISTNYVSLPYSRSLSSQRSRPTWRSTRYNFIHPKGDCCRWIIITIITLYSFHNLNHSCKMCTACLFGVLPTSKCRALSAPTTTTTTTSTRTTNAAAAVWENPYREWDRLTVVHLILMRALAFD